ncbi:MAG: aspartate aminotransferase family protein [Candidatus Omnitrophica bacterium]|nr:aspartate aminotransferase family protein [Candidatus Omnitrophota bacterium]
MKTHQIQKLYSDYILPTYKQFPVCFVRGKGARLWDLEDREYLDFFPGWGVSGLGHCHPAVTNAVKDQVRKIIHIPNNFFNLKQAQLAREIVRYAFPAKVFFSNSGAEAAEGAIKTARKFGAPDNRYEIITMKGSFHGRTFAAMAATGQERIHQGYGPMLEGFRYAEFNSLESVKKLVNEKTVAVFLEPILGEGGIHVATPEFMKGLRALCDEHKMLLMVDEVQTGMGRTGKMFGYQHYGIEPDVMTLAKSLGGGVPIGAFVVHEKIADGLFSAGMHGSTYGGNPLVASAALAVFKAIEKGGLLHKSIQMGDVLTQELEALCRKYDFIHEVRGVALMRALQLTVPGMPFVEAALKKGLIINCTQENVLRIMPSMTVTKGQILKAMHILDKVFSGK